jgi:transcriptional regulator with XRE-family HTH domain
MSHWINRISTPIPVDFEVLEESALAMAQATIQSAIKEAAISRADLARRMKCNRSIVSRMLSGEHNLTIKTMSRALGACGYEVRFNRVPIEWNWSFVPQIPQTEECPQHAGTSISTDAA